MARLEQEESKLRECTFAPKTLRGSDKRKLEDFLKDQQKHLDRKQENIARLTEDMKAKEESLIVLQPSINERSRVLHEGKAEDAPVHERLYARSKKPLEPAPSQAPPVAYLANLI
jgi:hypothetical protein